MSETYDLCVDQFLTSHFSFLISHLVTHHFSLFTVRCKYQLTRLTRLSLLDETFSIDEKVAKVSEVEAVWEV